MQQMNKVTDLNELKDQHANLDQRLNRLDRHRSLSPEEHYEMTVIKKRKLILKEQITKIESSLD